MGRFWSLKTKEVHMYSHQYVVYYFMFVSTVIAEYSQIIQRETRLYV